MAVNIIDADLYISQNVIDIEEWQGSDADRKTRLLNVAAKTLSVRYSKYAIPDEAVYEFVPVLATVFSDTLKMQRYGVKQFTVKGISYSFDGMNSSLETLIPQSSIRLIRASVGEDTSITRRVGRSVR